LRVIFSSPRRERQTRRPTGASIVSTQVLLLLKILFRIPLTVVPYYVLVMLLDENRVQEGERELPFLVE